MKRFYLESYGCQMNVYDTQGLSRMLEDHGFARVDQPESADVVLVNTCSVREHAEERTLNRLAVLGRLKAQNPDMKLGVCGCMAQRMGAEIKKRVPRVDLVVGAQALPAVLPALEALDRGEKFAPRVEPLDHYLPPPRPRFDAKNLKGFVTIIRGCNKACAYCIVPTTRGPEVSRHPDDLVLEVHELVLQGAREITLLGQNVNSYESAGVDFPELLARCGKVPGQWRLRFTTSHPRDMSEDLIAAFRHNAKLMPYLHLPVQSGSDRILKAMNRRHRVRDYLRLIERIRSSRSDIAVSGDFIVGFPGETEDDFAATLELVRKVEYASAFSFKYSPRPGTPAAEMAFQIDDAIAAERLQVLQDLLHRQRHAFNAACLGRRMDILVEKPGRHDGQLIGRSPYLQAIHIDGRGHRIGDMVTVTIDGVGANSLSGHIRMAA